MATFSVQAIEVFGRGVLKAEGVVIDKGNNVYGGGRNGIIQGDPRRESYRTSHLTVRFDS